MKASDLTVVNIVASALVAASNAQERGVVALAWWMTHADMDLPQERHLAAVQLAVGYATGSFSLEMLQPWKPSQLPTSEEGPDNAWIELANTMKDAAKGDTL